MDGQLLAEGRADGLPHRGAVAAPPGTRPRPGSSDARRRRASRSTSGAAPARPWATSSSSSASCRNVCWNDAQWSITATRRSFSPNHAPGRPQAPSASASSKASAWCSPGASRNGTELASSRCRAGLRRLLADPLPLLVLDERAPPGRDLAPGARVDDDEPRVADGAREAPAAVAVLAAFGAHARGQQRGRVGRGAHLVVEAAVGQLAGREVADVLEDPVGHQARADVVVEPGLGVHLVHPALGDPPLGVDLVVVEDHRDRHGREQPADRGGPTTPPCRRARTRRSRPARPPGRRRARARAASASCSCGRRLVGVDLVAEHHHHVGSGRPAPGRGEPLRVDAQRVDALALVVLVGAQDVRRLVRSRHAAGAEHDVATARRPAGGSCSAGTPSPPPATRARRRAAPRRGGRCPARGPRRRPARSDGRRRRTCAPARRAPPPRRRSRSASRSSRRGRRRSGPSVRARGGARARTLTRHAVAAVGSTPGRTRTCDLKGRNLLL